jgi:hypothetical protein
VRRTVVADERVAEGVDHLQAAALEMIAAARVFLDVAEDLVTDPERVAGTLASLAALADLIGRSGRQRAGAPPGDASGEAETGDRDARRSRLRSIEVS